MGEREESDTLVHRTTMANSFLASNGQQTNLLLVLEQKYFKRRLHGPVKQQGEKERGGGRDILFFRTAVTIISQASNQQKMICLM